MSEVWPTVVGTAAALASIASFAPQTIKIWRERDAEAVSLKTYSLTLTAFALWVAYGVLTSAWPLIVSNAAAFLMAATVVAMKVKFGRRSG